MRGTGMSHMILGILITNIFFFPQAHAFFSGLKLLHALQGKPHNVPSCKKWKECDAKEWWFCLATVFSKSLLPAHLIHHTIQKKWSRLWNNDWKRIRILEERQFFILNPNLTKRVAGLISWSHDAVPAKEEMGAFHWKNFWLQKVWIQKGSPASVLIIQSLKGAIFVYRNYIWTYTYVESAYSYR